jgi:hypothetical protein
MACARFTAARSTWPRPGARADVRAAPESRNSEATSSSPSRTRRSRRCCGPHRARRLRELRRCGSRSARPHPMARSWARRPRSRSCRRGWKTSSNGLRLDAHPLGVQGLRLLGCEALDPLGELRPPAARVKLARLVERRAREPLEAVTERPSSGSILPRFRAPADRSVRPRHWRMSARVRSVNARRARAARRMRRVTPRGRREGTPSPSREPVGRPRQCFPRCGEVREGVRWAVRSERRRWPSAASSSPDSGLSLRSSHLPASVHAPEETP